ncbi:MAG: SpoIIE family protein phosphatase [Solirubrobacterales bacterium]|nr:SpoIIE family protein phosphatase [Solirubrobacterales bacterium]
MSAEHDLLEDTAEDLFEDAPCGYLTTAMDGTVVKVNRTFEAWTGHARADLVGARRFQDLLSPGGRIYHETHYAPLLRMQGSVREIAVEIVRADGTRLPALINSVLRLDAAGEPRYVRTTVFDATERRRYEQELLAAGRRERDIALELQRSMLPESLPEAPGLDLEVAYHPADTGLEVGGDWYDAFWLEPGTSLGLVVGDVVGRGLGAAVTMGQLRSAVRALATAGTRPSALLESLDHYVRRYRVGQMATVVYAQLDVGSGELRYACAGHPPPLVLAPGDEPTIAWDGRSVPLDAHTTPRPRADGSLTLARGGAVILYTDGLIERRARSVDEGLSRLCVAAGELAGVAGGELAGPLAHGLRDREAADDVCVLAARRPR